jgi:hypothetical protein
MSQIALDKSNIGHTSKRKKKKEKTRAALVKLQYLEKNRAFELFEAFI